MNWLFSKLPGAEKRARRRAAARPIVNADHVDVHTVAPAELSVRNLSVSFAGNHVLRGISLDIRSGEVVGVIGPNGAGKTTLLEAITGYNRPRSGTIMLDGREITRLNPATRARLGVVRSFQSLELFEDLSVYDNLLVASDKPRWWQVLVAGIVPGRPPLGGAARAAVVAFGLATRLHDSPNDLSYGERRLLAIARALATRPRILLLDEPAAGLGATERAELRGIIRRIAEEWGIGVFLIEHDVELVMGVSDRVVALDFGQVIAAGDPLAVRNSPDVIAAYLGSEEPTEGAGPTTSFMRAVRKAGR
jgi:sulfate-transporting ATPase